MALTRLSYKKTWTNEKDFPTYEGSETQVREDMQYHPDAIKTYLNETLLPQLESSEGASHIGDEQRGNLAETLADFANHFAENDEAIRNLAGGETPEAMRAAKVSFTAEGWVEENGKYVLHIIQNQHKRLNDAFGYKLRSEAGSNTWEVLGTDVSYADGDVVLTAENSYNGEIVFFGV